MKRIIFLVFGGEYKELKKIRTETQKRRNAETQMQLFVWEGWIQLLKAYVHLLWINLHFWLKNWFMLSVRTSSYGCTREVWSAPTKRKSIGKTRYICYWPHAKKKDKHAIVWLRSVLIVKNCDRGLAFVLRSCQHFQARCHSFSLYRPT